MSRLKNRKTTKKIVVLYIWDVGLLGKRFLVSLNLEERKQNFEEDDEFISRMRFAEELGTPRTDEVLHPGRGSGVMRPAAVEDHRDLVLEAEQFFYHFCSVHHGHHQIRDDEIDRVFREDLKSLFSVLRFEDLYILDDLQKNTSHEVSDSTFIINDKDDDVPFGHGLFLSSRYERPFLFVPENRRVIVTFCVFFVNLSCFYFLINRSFS